MRLASPQGLTTPGDHFFRYLKDAFDVLYEDGSEQPKMLFDPSALPGDWPPGRFRAFATFSDYIEPMTGSWVTRRKSTLPVIGP